MGKYAIGLDYGTNSVRALVVDIRNGEEIGTYVFNYEHGEDGIVLDPKNPNVARQHPADYIKGMEVSIEEALKESERNSKEFRREDVIGIGIDTTGSTPLPVDRDGVPLAFHEDLKDNLNALAWLWKDHSSYEEAEEITELVKKKGYPYLNKYGGVYSSEWFFSKILHCLRVDPKVFEAAYSWVEICDFIPAVLTGKGKPEEIKRSVCAAGHKAMFNPEWGGLPSKEFLAELDPKLAALRDRLYDKAYTSDVPIGTISSYYAEKFRLNKDVIIAVGAFDAHMGGVGAGIKPGILVKVIGTSTCDMMVVPNSEKLFDIPGLCGIVDGSILPGYYGLEAGQSAVGDIFNWFVKYLVPREYFGENAENKSLHQLLTEKAQKLRTGESGLLALDWNNGNRTILVDAKLTGLLIGQTLHTKPEEIYRALIEATGFGARVIMERFEEYGVKVNEVIACGGISEKNPFVMQVYADILGKPIKISYSSQTPALGAAIFGAVAAGYEKSGYRNVEEAQQSICRVKDIVYYPRPADREIYNRLYKLYKELHDIFGTKNASYNLYHIMKDLIEIRDKVKGVK